MATGTVKFFDRAKGFGFITRDDGEKDVYVNRADVKAEEGLVEGDKVQFDVEAGQRGPRATNVSKA